MQRDHMLSGLRDRGEPWDVLVIGGGATGLGVAVDAASRGYDVCLLERSDFAKGTSSRSTKLVHGGVRYLQQGNVSLVMEALKERGLLRRNAPHLVHDLAFVVPTYDWWASPFYGIGLKVYDMLAGKYGFGRSRVLSKSETLEHIPTIETDGLRGGVVYYDGQFDDARLAISLALTAADHGATLVNYVAVTGLNRREDGFIGGVRARDEETGEAFEPRARIVVNATGPFTDGVRRMESPEAKPMIAPSQGVHIVLDKRYLPGDAAIMVPHTDDGRVLFAIPWHDRVVVGTTDTPIDDVSPEPTPLDAEVEFLLGHAAKYLNKDPSPGDVLSCFAGVRPLVTSGAGGGDAEKTSAISRDHVIHVSDAGLLTIAGGKWTTYRKMAEDAVDHAATLAGLPERDCITRDLKIHAAADGTRDVYGAARARIDALARTDPSLAERIHPKLPVTRAEVVWGAREEMARTVDDVLARRRRSLILDARSAIEAASIVADVLRDELGRDGAWRDRQIETFTSLARAYLID